MDFLPRLIGKITRNDELLFLYRKLHQRWESVTNVIVYTRSYRDGLDFADRCDGLNEYFWNGEFILYEEYERFDENVILLRLTMYDKLDWFDDYIRYFEKIRDERNYETTLWPVNSFTEPYIIRREGDRVYKHFLVKQRDRYDLINRKLDKFKRREKLGNMLHRKQSELTEEEIEHRFEKAIAQADLIRHLVIRI